LAATSNPRPAEELGLTIEGVNHFTIPVRDHDKARKFWVELLGGVVRREPDWESVRKGRSNSTAMAVRMCEGMELDLFYQPFGQGEPDQAYPHNAFWVQAPQELDEFRTRLEGTGVPTVLMTRQVDPAPGQPCTVELHFRDPDGNPVEIACRNYPFREGVHVGPFDRWQIAYLWRDWPKAQ